MDVVQFTMEEVQFCKNCKRDISLKNYVIHSVHCERKIKLCDRCSEPVPLSELKKHDEEFHSESTCPDCGISMEKWQIEKHKETCVKKLVPCKYCELEIPSDKLPEHSAVCGSRTEQCIKCNKHVMKKDLEEHPAYCLKKILDPLTREKDSELSRKVNSDVFDFINERYPVKEAVPCEHCGLQVNWNELMDHIALCETRTERCFLCDEHVMVKDRDTHFVTCGKALSINESIACDYCGNSFNLINIQRHVELCGLQTEKCHKCKHYVQKKDWKLHLSICEQKENKPLEFPCEYCGQTFPSDFLEDHSLICGSQNKKCEQCAKFIPLKNMDSHLNLCKYNSAAFEDRIPCEYCEELFPGYLLGRHARICISRTEQCKKCEKLILLSEMKGHQCMQEKNSVAFEDHIPCKFCEELFPSIVLEHHVKKCILRTEKCEKCGKLIGPSEKKEHQCGLKKNVSKTHGDCCVCHQSVPWVDMNLHTASCAQIYYDTSVYDHQNKLNELALEKESEALVDSTDKKKHQVHENKKRCSFCFEKFPSHRFAEHSEVCEKRPYKCEKCLKPMPYRRKENHAHSCLGQQIKSHNANYNVLRDEETKENKELKFLKDRKSCSFCFAMIPSHDFSQHLEVCEEHLYKCEKCLKEMPYRSKEIHVLSCLNQQNKSHYEDDNLHHEEEITDNNELKKLKKCQFCSKRFPDVLFTYHLEECEHREEQGSVCSENVPVKDMQNHRLFKCSYGDLRGNGNFNKAEALTDKTTEEKKNQFHEDRKRCAFCFDRFPSYSFSQHLDVCDERPYSCHVCQKDMPYRKKDEHVLWCQDRQKESYAGDHNNKHAETILEPSMEFERMRHLEKNVELCPSCKCKIPEQRYHDHLLLCYEGETRCHFCHKQFQKSFEHSHFRSCPGISNIVEESKNSKSKKKQEQKNKGKSLSETIGKYLSSFMATNKEKSAESRNTRQAIQESHPWQSYRGQSYEREKLTPALPPTLNEVSDLLPCEFCNEMWPFELIIEHQSGCRPDLVSFPKSQEESDENLVLAAAATNASGTSPTTNLGAIPKGKRDEDNEWKVQSRRNNRASNRENTDSINKENMTQKQLNSKEKFFFYSSQNTGEAPKTQPANYGNKQYSQLRESQETSKTKPDKGIGAIGGVKKDNFEKDQFSSFKFRASRISDENDEFQNISNSWKENDGILSTAKTDKKSLPFDEPRNNSFYSLQALSVGSDSRVDFTEPYFKREIKAVGAERTEKNRSVHSKKDVDLSVVKKDLKEISLQKSITFDENDERNEPFKSPETVESKTSNISMPAVWNTDYNSSCDKTYPSHFLESFSRNNDYKKKDDTLSNTAENNGHKKLSSSTQDSDYDKKNNETFGSDFMEYIDKEQNKDDENGIHSEDNEENNETFKSDFIEYIGKKQNNDDENDTHSDDTFYDADDGIENDAVNENFLGNNNAQEENLSHYDFNNLNLSTKNQNENLYHTKNKDLNAAIKLEEEDSHLKDSDLNGYIQFLRKSIKESNETIETIKAGWEKFDPSVNDPYLKTSLKDTIGSKYSSEPMQMESSVMETEASNQIKLKKSSLEFCVEETFKDENFANDEAKKWKRWRLPEISDSD